MDLFNSHSMYDKIDNIESNTSYKKNKNIALSRIIFIYAISFFIVVIFSLLDCITFINASIFLLILLLVIVVNYLFLNSILKENALTELYNSVLNGAIKSDNEFYIIFNSLGEVEYTDPRVYESFFSHCLKNSNELQALIEALKIPNDKTQEIYDFIYRVKFSYNQKEIGIGSNIKKKKSLNIYPFTVLQGTYGLFLFNIEKPKNYTFLKIYKIKNEVNKNKAIDDLLIGFYELDPKTGNILDVNNFFSKLLGYKKNEFLDKGLKIDSIVDLEESMDSLITSSNSQKALYGNWQGFLTFNTKFHEKIHTFVIQKTSFKDNGNIEKVYGYAIKLHDQSLILKSRGVEKGWIDYSWQCFFENSPYPVVIVDLSGAIIRLNNSFQELLGEPISSNKFVELFDETDRPQILEQLGKLVMKSNYSKSIGNVRFKNNNKVLEVYFGKILDLSGNPFGYMVRIADLTQQKELEDNLSHAQRMQTIGHLVGSVAHDFNNLLTAISGFCDLLFMRHSVGDPSFAHIMQIKQSADRAANLVKRLLAFSRKQTLQMQIINIGDLFNDLSRLVQRLIGTEIILTQHVDPDIWAVKLDPVQMEQVILNLVINAQHAMGNNGHLIIKANNVSIKNKNPYLEDYIAPAGEDLPPEGDYVAIEVEDNGSGIKPEILQKIFEPFFTTKDDKSGTGLGLATVYGIIRQTGGYIYVKSKVSQGTSFLIYLKRYNISIKEQIELQQQEREKIKQEEEARKDTTGKGLIALVEDEEAIRIFANSVLVNKGYDVIDFSSAKVALEEVKKKIDQIDLIISDVMMPEMTGPAFINEIRKVKPSVKVIFISGYGEEVFSQEYGENRDFHFIPKPFSLKQLVTKVKEVLTD
jgi:two-component system cell cycle sensor histidine kinase/response regulator CckA